MKRFWKWLAMVAYRQWSKGQPDRRMPDGVPGNRDPDNPCTAYAPRSWQMQDWRDCQTDGHYLCRGCCHRAKEVDEVTR
jgi:hypothetical protein